MMTTLTDFLIEGDPEYSKAVSQFKDVICDLVDEGVDPDVISAALASLGYGT